MSHLLHYLTENDQLVQKAHLRIYMLRVSSSQITSPSPSPFERRSRPSKTHTREASSYLIMWITFLRYVVVGMNGSHFQFVIAIYL